jgi:hypothetical protein
MGGYTDERIDADVESGDDAREFGAFRQHARRRRARARRGS